MMNQFTRYTIKLLLLECTTNCGKNQLIYGTFAEVGQTQSGKNLPLIFFWGNHLGRS